MSSLLRQTASGLDDVELFRGIQCPSLAKDSENTVKYCQANRELLLPSYDRFTDPETCILAHMPSAGWKADEI